MVSFGFWCEGGSRTGLGHIQRCLALAAEARSQGIAEILFVLRDSAQELSEVIRAAGFPVQDESANGFFECDFAFLDVASHEMMSNSRLLRKRIEDARQHADYLIWIDSFEEDSIVAHPQYRFDFVVTPYLGAEFSAPPNCRVWLAGAKYAVLDPVYRKPCEHALTSRTIKRLLVSMGGADEARLTERVLDSSAGFPNLERRVVIGPLFSRTRIVEIQSGHPDCEVISGRQNIRDDLCLSDFLVTSPGLTRYEAAAIGIPTLIVSKDQRYGQYLRMFEESGLARVVFMSSPIDFREISDAILDLLRYRRKISTKARLIDGFGAKRVIDTIVENFGS